MWLMTFTALLTLVTSIPAKAELTVVKTIPESGAKNVDFSLTEIRIWFSAPVKTNSWSLVMTDEGEVPEIIGNPAFESNTLCVLRVKLNPNTTYSIGINSATKRGFKSARDEKVTCTPYVLTFTTAGGRPNDEKRSSTSSQKAGPAKDGGTPKTVLFRKYVDKIENAFTILVPKGWQTEGGMVRIDPTAAGGAAQSIEAKLDFAVKKDERGTVMIRWLPHIYYADPKFMGIAASMFPPGSNYGGMMVLPCMSAHEFATKMVFPHLHASVQPSQIAEQRNLPELAALYQRLLAESLGPYFPDLNFQYDAGIVTADFEEGGIRYREKILVVIENRGQIAAGQWCNKLTIALRAPGAEFEAWAPILAVIADSSVPNPQWIAGEVQGQIRRGEIVARTQQEIQRIERDIVEHRQKTNAEIHNDMFLTLTDQEEYINPHTGEVEIGSNQWNNRWENDNGDVIYTNDGDYDPNYDLDLNVQGFKRSKIRQR